jgi:hypothetical protein
VTASPKSTTAVTDRPAPAPTVRAHFRVRGERDLDILFGFVHELLKAEGTSTLYSLVSPHCHVRTGQDATGPAAAVARAVRGGVLMDEVTIPGLKDPASGADANPEGLNLWSPSVDWIREKAKLWLAQGGRKADQTFEAARPLPLPPEPTTYATLLRTLHWALATAAGSGRSLNARWFAPEGARRLDVQLDGPETECSNCRTRHARMPCEAVITAAGVRGVKGFEVLAGPRVARFRPGERATQPLDPDFLAPGMDPWQHTPPQLFVQTPDLDELERAFKLWTELALTPWDLEPHVAKSFPPPLAATLHAEAKFDEARELAKILGPFQGLVTAEGGPPLGLELKKHDRSAKIEGGTIRFVGPAPWVLRSIAILEPALGRKLDPEIQASRRIAAYGRPTYFLVFKALHWLSRSAGTARELELAVTGPDATHRLALEGQVARCELCSAEHVPGLCERVVAIAGPSRIASLAVVPGPGERLEVRPVALETWSRGPNRDLAARRLDEWTAIERTPWDVP